MKKPHGSEAYCQTQESTKCDDQPEGGQSQKWSAIGNKETQDSEHVCLSLNGILTGT